MTILIQPLSAPLGAIVTGWDPTRDLALAEVETIQAALRAHLVLVFRGQPEIDDLDLIRFAGHFGELLTGSEFLRDAGDHPEILPVTNMVDDEGVAKGTGESNEIDWHSDYSYVDRVGKESFLNALILPANPPHTSFTNQYRALESLPRETVERLRPLRAFHSVKGYFVDGGEGDAIASETHRAKIERDEKLGISRPPIPEAEHPVVVQHPESGREALYISPQITRHIIGLPPAESDALLRELNAHSTRSEHVFHHDWEPGDLVVFDNIGTMHRRDTWDARQPRYMRQLSTVCRVD